MGLELSGTCLIVGTASDGSRGEPRVMDSLRSAASNGACYRTLAAPRSWLSGTAPVDGSASPLDGRRVLPPLTRLAGISTPGQQGRVPSQPRTWTRRGC